jgi:coproporphyrinogen III oxidase
MRFVEALHRVGEAVGAPQQLEAVEWLRDEGTHGGGVRYAVASAGIFDRGSVNVSQVHYDDLPDKKLGSATALSTIIHPAHPRAPSVHIHVSWTELRDGRGYWRMMADLNPSIPDEEDTRQFAARLREAAPEQYADASAQGDRYFFIPALRRHRGATHFYLEDYATDDPVADARLARRVGEAAIDAYVEILQRALQRHGIPTALERAEQLAYHTLYLFQVLTLDRGTTSGLLVHDQNDLGIMGSLPSHVDRAKLASWRELVDAPQGDLVDALVGALPDRSPAPVTDDAKLALARSAREFYRAHPEALQMQASGDVAVPTVDNHR